MRLFTIAKKKRETCGMGDTIEQEYIMRMGDYGTGEYPPLFSSEKDAQEWVDRLKENILYSHYKYASVVSLRCDFNPKRLWGLSHDVGEEALNIVSNKNRLVLCVPETWTEDKLDGFATATKYRMVKPHDPCLNTCGRIHVEYLNPETVSLSF
jgi:hypothetical protein